MDELNNIFYLQKYLFFFGKLCFLFCSFFLFLNIWFQNQQSYPNKKQSAHQSLYKVRKKKIIKMVHFMAFSCKTGSIDRCLELNATAAALVAFAGLLVWLSVQLKIIPPRTSSASIFLSVFFLFFYELHFWVFASVDSGLFKPGRWGGQGGGGRCGLTLQGLFERLPAWKHQNINGSHLRSTSDPAACDRGAERLCQGDLQSAGRILAGTTQSEHQRSPALQFSTTNFYRS